LVLTVLAAVWLGGAAVAGAAPRGPAQAGPRGGYAELAVPSTMGPVKVQVQWARRGGNAALYLLDGLRARNDRNAWSFETNALQQFAGDNLTLVMPVGGQSSFYTDWYEPSNLNGQKITYKWETFLTRELPAYLTGYGVSPHNDAVLGLSMGGSSALTLAAYHHDQFKFAGSLSGFPDISAPGMRVAMRLAMLDAGRYSVDAMWGPPWSESWSRNDPFEFAARLRGISLFISAGNGVPLAGDLPMGAANLVDAIGLETLSDIETHAFQIKMVSLGVPATYDYTWAGVHAWPYWQSELWKARPQILDVLNAR
jgi:diacylglycerol O-acyltransferase/trehalose O-mycolyltransferase